MYLIQILLPLYNNEGAAIPADLHQRVREDLSHRYGGFTAFSRAPAEGQWEADGKTARDDIVVLEVMAQELDRPWWSEFRTHLERTFQQEAIVIRAQEVELL